MKKAQMSLEMIVGLLILLVVAVVIIRWFLTVVNPKTIPDPKEAVKFLEFKAKCENLCNNFLNYGTKASLSKYCSERLLGDDDLNNNGIIDSFDADTLSLKICEDTVYCFHIVPCKTSTGIVSWGQCRESICNAKYEVYNDMSKADEKVKELVPGPGSCELPADENWWEFYFGDKPCTSPGTPPAEQFDLSLGACRIDSTDSWSFSCEITSTGSCNNGRIVVTNSNLQGTLWATHGEDTVGTVNFGENTLNGNLVRPAGESEPQTGTCLFAYQCDTNGDDKITEDDFKVVETNCLIT